MKRAIFLLLVILCLSMLLVEPVFAQQSTPQAQSAVQGQVSPLVRVLGLLVLLAPAALIAWRSWGKQGAPKVKQRA